MNFFPSEFFSSELLSSDFWYSHRQTDGKRRIRAHRALAQVGSKTVGLSHNGTRFIYVLFFTLFYETVLVPRCHI